MSLVRSSGELCRSTPIPSRIPSKHAELDAAGPGAAAKATLAFVLESLDRDARDVDRALMQPLELLWLIRIVDAACNEALRGDRKSDRLLHLTLFHLYERLLRIPMGVEGSGYGSVSIQAVQARIEQYVVDSLRARVALPAEHPPEQPRPFVRWLKKLARRHFAAKHPFYTTHLRRDADIADLRHYFIQELTVDGRFDDLVALMQVGTTGGAKLELANNYWDEMGRGDPAGVHTDLFGRVIAALDITAADVDEARTHESRVCGNLSVMLAVRREHFYRAAGYLGLTEFMVPPRMADVLAAWRRNGLPEDGVAYHKVHLPIDARHAHGWFTNVVEPAVALDPDTRMHVLEGAMWRLETSCAYLDSLMAHARERKEQQQ